MKKECHSVSDKVEKKNQTIISNEKDPSDRRLPQDDTFILL